MTEREPVAQLIHELRTPLAVVSGFAELLQTRGDALTEQQRAEYLARIVSGTRELDEILSRPR
jgi:signal transduction histidine kinase